MSVQLPSLLHSITDFQWVIPHTRCIVSDTSNFENQCGIKCFLITSSLGATGYFIWFVIFLFSVHKINHSVKSQGNHAWKQKHLKAKIHLTKFPFSLRPREVFWELQWEVKSGREKDKDFIVKVISNRHRTKKKKKGRNYIRQNQSKKAEWNESQKCLLRIWKLKYCSE